MLWRDNLSSLMIFIVVNLSSIMFMLTFCLFYPGSDSPHSPEWLMYCKLLTTSMPMLSWSRLSLIHCHQGDRVEMGAEYEREISQLRYRHWSEIHTFDIFIALLRYYDDFSMKNHDKSTRISETTFLSYVCRVHRARIIAWMNSSFVSNWKKIQAHVNLV